MAAAAGKKSATSLSLFMETHGLEVKDELSTMAIQYWEEGAWTREWSHEQKEAWMRQIREVQTWKQVRGPPGAVMCEVRDLGMKWSCWHSLSLVLGDEIKIDTRCVCPKGRQKDAGIEGPISVLEEVGSQARE